MTDQEFANVLTKFRRSAEIMQMRKRCRIEIEQTNSEEAKRHIVILDAELVRRGLRVQIQEDN